jgi:type II secretory ATPase GspE/PulE/Tfp pilus assembly ATPase PilB-like protein
MEGELRAKAAQEKLSAKLAEKRKEKLHALQAEGKQHKKHACKHCDGTYFKHRIGAHMINNHAEELQRRLAPGTH